MRPRRSSCDCCLTPPMPGSRCTSTSHPSQQTTVKCLYPHKAWMLHGAKANPRSSWLASIGCPLPPLLGPGMVGAPVPLGPAGPLGVAALAAVVALACEGLGALGPAGDRPHPGALPRRAALGGHLGHCLGADRGELFGAADAGEPLGVRTGTYGHHALVERQERRIQRACRPSSGRVGARAGEI